MTTPWAACHIPGYEQRTSDGHLETRPITEGAGITPAFLESLIKRSVEAEEILQDSGRIRFQRAIQAAVELYLEQQNIRPADIGGK